MHQAGNINAAEIEIKKIDRIKKYIRYYGLVT